MKKVSSPLMVFFRITKQTNWNEHNMVQNPSWKEPTSRLFTSVAKDFNSGQLWTNSVSDQSGTRTRDHWIASLMHRPLGQAASLKLRAVHVTSCKVFFLPKTFLLYGIYRCVQGKNFCFHTQFSHSTIYDLITEH